MKTIWINNDALMEILSEQGIEFICNENMDIVVSDEDAERIPAIVEEYAPAAVSDYGFEEDDMMDELINQIDFTAEEYNEETAGQEGVATFEEFINNILSSVKENDGTIEDAVAIANDAFNKISQDY